ncbi:enoyl-CoA hydratase-related protein [Legionella jordanis]|uniref:Enoyl CoA hydratase/isomerase (Crotonase) n=1 Tax=Legionella jordanis TaxID=456 RepID=A0A0W0V9X4_9GAMM|nr:enoyl-CoA hydratase-related protein [Legionella jordanis]KTD16669.1 enoyl CoA hydratase/isomerase (crotonase) [Legionella jordanis]RMX03797.1 gamma-carboxygeranoyl-CoA hydratase [Legionella jordanis]RMX22142.1 gamma-carboxygeranoyl-CoA hydratase [Legionella jordanis]VEH11863.1 enoyl CoA hydratase/isomerase (crotonase) [Legionella jordanis]HAT8712829.1 gamma-carboxygeranoyl-CoA hydratase [Legionella jordanis]
MSDLLTDIQDRVFIITLNRVDKHNAFDDKLLAILLDNVEQALADDDVRAIVLRANGRHFSAGADLSWMKRMALFSEEENQADALILARVMAILHLSSKPTIAVIQGSAFGGGAGLAAACDISIAAQSARFCFSEVKLGLIPAVISPYVVKAIGERAAKWLFMSAESFDAARAKELGLVHHCVADEGLWDFALTYAKQITQLAPQAVRESKALVEQVSGKAITEEILQYTASLIAKKRVSPEGQQGLHAFLNKETPNWN